MQAERDLIDIAPRPSFRRIVALNDWVSSSVEVLGGMSSRRLIAATDMATLPADSQMYPFRPGLEAFLAASRAGLNFHYGADVRTMGSHDDLL